jgi:hypothetical protein
LLIRALEAIQHPGTSLAAGQEGDVPEALAVHWIRMGLAVRVGERLERAVRRQHEAAVKVRK